MSFPTTGPLDDFNRANEGPPPSANWSFPAFPGDDGLKIITNVCGPNGASFSNSYWNTPTPSADCEAYAIVSTVTANGHRMWIYARFASPGTSGVDGYEVGITKQAGTDEVRLHRVDNGSLTQLGATISQEFSGGDGFGIEAIGSTIKAYYGSGGTATTEIGSRTASTYSAAGYIGLEIESTAGRWNDFGGGSGTAAVAADVSKFPKTIMREAVR